MVWLATLSPLFYWKPSVQFACGDGSRGPHAHCPSRTRVVLRAGSALFGETAVEYEVERAEKERKATKAYIQSQLHFLTQVSYQTTITTTTKTVAGHVLGMPVDGLGGRGVNAVGATSPREPHMAASGNHQWSGSAMAASSSHPLR
jgi:hypothetical protein